MADAEDGTREPGQPHPEGHVEAVEHHPAQPVGVVPGRRHHRRDRVAALLRHGAQDLQAPRPHRPARRLAVSRVPGEHLRQPLFAQHGQRLLQPVEQVGGRRIGEEPLLVGREHGAPVPVGPRQARAAVGGEGLLADDVEAEPRRQHQPLLRRPHRDVDRPLVVPVVDRPQRRDGVDEEQGRVPGVVDGPADEGDAAGRPRRRLVVHHAHGLDGVLPVGLQALVDLRGVDPAPPVAGDPLDVQAQPFGDLLPESREVAGLEHQDAVAGREHVDEGRLPRPGARGGIDDHRPRGAEHLAHPVEQLAPERPELGAAVVDRGLRHGAQHPPGDVGGPGNLQEVTAGSVGHGARSPVLNGRTRSRTIYHSAVLLPRGREPRPRRRAPRTAGIYSTP